MSNTNISITFLIQTIGTFTTTINLTFCTFDATEKREMVSNDCSMKQILTILVRYFRGKVGTGDF